MNLEVQSHFDTGDELAEKAAGDLAERILSLAPTRAVHIVLTGGIIGIRTLTELAPLLANQDLANLHFWWGDERFVRDTSHDSNFFHAYGALLSKISIPSENLHQIHTTGSESVAESAAAFAAHIETISPKFDIVLLGMGADGHVASLFPGATPTGHGNLVVSEAHSPKPPSERISLSFAALSSAREVWFLVAGAEKAAAVQKVFADKELPASQISGQELTRWYLDTAAAGKLTF